MKRLIIFLMMAWTCLSMTRAQVFVVNSEPKTITIKKGKEEIPLKQGQKIDTTVTLCFSTNATLDLINVESQKRHILNVKKGNHGLAKLIKQSKGIDLSLAFLRYLLEQLFARISVSSGDGNTIGGVYRDDEDMFNIQEWLDNDSINNADTLNIHQNFAVPPLGKDSIGNASTPDADAKQ